MVNRQRFKDKRQRIPKGKYKMDSLEKLATRRGNKKWTIQRNWQQDEEKQNKNTQHNMCLIPLYANKHK